ncbi:MAG UNVERIFIED_CONTAM: hypothetical protein LVT10_09905 [Anaerolineae bacterium]
MCDNIVIINRGEIVAKGSPATLRCPTRKWRAHPSSASDGMDSGDTRETARLHLREVG